MFSIKQDKNPALRAFFSKYLQFRSSIYSRVVLIITILSVFLFTSYSIIFRSVNNQYLNAVIRQNGNNVGSVVEGALYYSMLENDKGALQRTLDVINTMAGIDEVNLYDSRNNLVYSSFSPDADDHSDPNCLNCHKDIDTMFPREQKSYRIIDVRSECSMNHNDNDHRHLLIRSPILNEKSCYVSDCHAHTETDKVLGSLVIKIPLKEFDSTVTRSTTQYFIISIFATFVVGLLLIFFTRRRIQQPLNSILKASKAVASGDLSKRLEIKHNQLEDIQMVSLALNNMLDHLQSANKELENWSKQLEYKVQKKSEELMEAQHELIRIERIASLGKLSASVAHEINNPLSGILVYTKLIHKQLSNPDITEEKKNHMLHHLKLIENETKRCGDIVKGLLDFSRKDQAEFESKHLHEIIKETCDLMTHSIKMANIRFFKDLDATKDLIFCSPNQVKQACVALLVNASEAVGENGEIQVRTSNVNDESVRIDISDNGVGISTQDMPHIFEPFFSTKQDMSGIGLGLAIVHGIVQNHKGKIEVRSEPGKGTTMSITFPLAKIQKQE